MTLELSTEEQAALQLQVDAGEYATVEGAARGALRKPVEDYQAWLAYVRTSIAAGLDDIANGRISDAAEVIDRLKARATRSAA